MGVPDETLSAITSTRKSAVTRAKKEPENQGIEGLWGLVGGLIYLRKRCSLAPESLTLGARKHNWTRQFGTYSMASRDTSIVLVYHLGQVKLSGYERSSLGGAGLAGGNALFTAKSPGVL